MTLSITKSRSHEILRGYGVQINEGLPNGKAEAGRYFLWRAVRSQGDLTPYVEVSKARYKANYIHAVATMIIAVPAFVAIWATHRIRSSPSCGLRALSSANRLTAFCAPGRGLMMALPTL